MDHKKVLQTLLVSTVFSAYFIILPYSINAQSEAPNKKSVNIMESVKISPAIYTPLLSPGKKIKYQLQIENLLAVPVPVNFQAQDFNIEAKTGNFLLEENPQSSMTGWISISPKDIILNPKEKRTVNVTVETPKKIPFGSYYSFIFATAKLPEKIGSSSFVNAKVGAVLVSNIGETTTGYKNAVLHLKNMAPEIKVFNNHLNIEFSVKNMALHYFVARPFVTVYGFLGASTQKTSLEEKYLFPGKERLWKSKVKTSLVIPGIYRYKLAVSVGNGEVLERTKFLIYTPFWLIFSIFMTISTVYLTVKNKKIILKKIKFLQKFFKKN